MVASINEANPDVLWVGMTAPKQEKWVEENRHQLHAAVIGSIGAVFDFYAGSQSAGAGDGCAHWESNGYID